MENDDFLDIDVVELKETLKENIKQKQNYFCSNIEKLVIEKRLTYLEAITFFCEKHDLPIEHAAGLINFSIRDHLYSEGMKLNLLKKVNQLPL